MRRIVISPLKIKNHHIKMIQEVKANWNRLPASKILIVPIIILGET